jgi:uncharacterized damage-inducible protein DinB
MKEEMQVNPYDAMWREVGCLYRALEMARAALEKSVEGLSQDALHAGGGAPGASIGSLLAGCGAEEAAWIHQRWRKADVARAPAGTPTLEAVLAWMREVREATRLALMKATDADLDRRTIASEQGLASLRWVLFHLLDTASSTRGRIAALRGSRR